MLVQLRERLQAEMLRGYRDANTRPSIVLDRGMKWIGPMWPQVDENQVFRFTPTKTEGTT